MTEWRWRIILFWIEYWQYNNLIHKGILSLDRPMSFVRLRGWISLDVLLFRSIAMQSYRPAFSQQHFCMQYSTNSEVIDKEHLLQRRTQVPYSLLNNKCRWLGHLVKISSPRLDIILQWHRGNSVSIATNWTEDDAFGINTGETTIKHVISPSYIHILTYCCYDQGHSHVQYLYFVMTGCICCSRRLLRKLRRRAQCGQYWRFRWIISITAAQIDAIQPSGQLCRLGTPFLDWTLVLDSICLWMLLWRTIWFRPKLRQ